MFIIKLQVLRRRVQALAAVGAHAAAGEAADLVVEACLAEAPDAAVLGAFGDVGVAVAAVLARALVRSVVLLAVR